MTSVHPHDPAAPPRTLGDRQRPPVTPDDRDDRSVTAGTAELRRLLAEPSCVACLTGVHHPDRPDHCGCPCSWPPDVLARAAVVSVRRHPAGWAACHGAR